MTDPLSLDTIQSEFSEESEAINRVSVTFKIDGIPPLPD